MSGVVTKVVNMLKEIMKRENLVHRIIVKDMRCYRNNIPVYHKEIILFMECKETKINITVK